MKRFLSGTVCAVLIAFGGAAIATASTDLELISGGNNLFIGTSTTGVLLCNGLAANCAAFGATGFATAGGFAITATSFNGWAITVSSLGSNTPNCPAAGPGGPGCIDSTNITAQSTGAGTLGAFDFSDGFTVNGAFRIANTSALQTGLLESQQAYATTAPADPLGIGTTTFAAAVAGQTSCGSALTSAPPGVTADPMTCPNPGVPVGLELATIFTTDSGGGGFDVGGNISDVPEPAAVALFGTVLALFASGLRRRRKLS